MISRDVTAAVDPSRRIRGVTGVDGVDGVASGVISRAALWAIYGALGRAKNGRKSWPGQGERRNSRFEFGRNKVGAFSATYAVALLAAAAATRPAGLRDPVEEELAMRLVSAAENSSLDWRAQYGYVEYDVEHDAKENRGYTGGIVGFTSRTHDMLELVRRYDAAAPHNPLSPFLGALAEADGTASRHGLGRAFVEAWKQAAADPAFRAAQDAERDRVYFDPAVDRAVADGLHELGQFCYYDAIVMHGDGDDAGGFGGIRAAAMKHAKTPAAGGDETAYLNAFLDARVAAMKAEKAHDDTSRVETAQRRFLREGNFALRPPLAFAVYGDNYRIDPQPAGRPRP